MLLTLAEDIGKYTCGDKWEHSHPFFFFFLYLGESISAGPDWVPSASTEPQPDGPFLPRGERHDPSVIPRAGKETTRTREELP